jgi:hypothetical protein
MRITFFEMWLLNDTSQMHDTSFIQNKKEWGESNIYTEKERAKSERWSVAENGLQRGS